MDPTWTSILPAFVAIALAFATRRVVPALFAAVVTGGMIEEGMEVGGWEVTDGEVMRGCREEDLDLWVAQEKPSSLFRRT